MLAPALPPPPFPPSPLPPPYLPQTEPTLVPHYQRTLKGPRLPLTVGQYVVYLKAGELAEKVGLINHISGDPTGDDASACLLTVWAHKRVEGTGDEEADETLFDIEAEYEGDVFKHGKNKEERIKRDNVQWAFYHENGMPVTELSDSGDVEWINLVEFSKKLKGSDIARGEAPVLDVDGGFFLPGPSLASWYA